MPYSAGVYTLPSNSFAVPVTGTTISSSAASSTFADFATAFSTCFLKDGTQTITANLPMSSFKFTGLGAGSAAGDSLRWEQLGIVTQNSQSANYTAVLTDAGASIDHPSTDANARTFTIPANSSVAYTVGTVLSFSNMTANVVTIAITTDTLYMAGSGSTGSRSLAQYGVATARKITSTTWLISGTGLS